MSDTPFTSKLKRVQSITFVELLATLSFAMLLVSIVILFEVKTAFFQRTLWSVVFIDQLMYCRFKRRVGDRDAVNQTD